MRTARLLITEKCNRRCAGCCNGYSTIMRSMKPLQRNDLSYLRNYDNVAITGGEPLLFVDYTEEIIRNIRGVCSSNVYLYTAFYPGQEDFVRIIKLLDGIQFSIHAEADEKDIKDFEQAQTFLRNEMCARDISCRCFIDNKVTHKILIQPNVWKRVEVKAWLSEEELLKQCPNNGLPDGEEMFILR